MTAKSAKETESQKYLREALEAQEKNRRKVALVHVSRTVDAPGEDCPGCHGNSSSRACQICGI